MRRSNIDPEFLLFGAFVVVAAVVLGFIVVMASKQDDHWRTWCESQGGHVKSVNNSGYGITTAGKYAWTTTTTVYCLSADGRILDIE